MTTNHQAETAPKTTKRPSSKRSSGNRSGKRPGTINTDRLKTTLVVGGLLATYLGADLLASTDTTQASPEPEPQQMSQTIEIPSSSAAEGFTLTLDPIIDVVSADQIPKPVAKSRSSQ